MRKEERYEEECPCFFVIMMILEGSFAEDIVKVMDFEGGKNSTSMLTRSTIDDERTGSSMVFSEDGTLYIQNWDEYKMLKVNVESRETSYDFDLKPYKFSIFEELQFVGTDYYLFAGNGFKVKIFDKNYKLKADFNNEKLGLNVDLAGIYYDEKSDILFFRNNSEQRNVCCLVHPSMDNEKNRQNYHNHIETVDLIKNRKYPNMNHLGLNENEKLTVDGVPYYFAGCSLNGMQYQPFEQNKFYLYNADGLFKEMYVGDDTGRFWNSSLAIHPSGDLYILRADKQSFRYSLYRIQNTWDASYRREWYKAHPVKESSSKSENQTASSDLSLPGKTLACSDNLRLRAEDSASSSVVVSMLKGTKVKVLKTGHEETIDGIKGNWVQVEVLDGAKDKDGKPIKTGTKGWCFAGYLE